MADEKIDKARWQTFFDALSERLESEPVAIEMVGMDVGDQVEDEALALAGMTYEPADDVLYLYVHKPGAVTHTTHSLSAPMDIYAESDESGVRRIAIFDSEGREILVHLGEPIMLPLESSRSDKPAAKGRPQKSPQGRPEPRR